MNNCDYASTIHTVRVLRAVWMPPKSDVGSYSYRKKASLKLQNSYTAFINEHAYNHITYLLTYAMVHKNVATLVNLYANNFGTS